MVIASRARQGRKPKLIHLLVAGTVLFPVITLFSSLGGGVIASMGRNESLTGRNEIWRTVISVSKNPWFGTGYETFWLGDRLHQVWTGVGQQINEAHNGFLEVYLNLGWVGIGILALLLCTGYRNILLEFRRDTLMAALKVAYFVACVIYSLTEAGFRLLSPIWLLFLVAIMDIPALSHAAPRFGFDLDHSEGIREHASEVSNVLTVG